MLTTLLALHVLQNRLTDHTIGLMSNTLVVTCINKQEGTLSSSLYLFARQVLAWADSNSMNLIARYIPGPRNVVTDLHGRRGQVTSMECSLHTVWLQRGSSSVGDSDSGLVFICSQEETTRVPLSSSLSHGLAGGCFLILWTIWMPVSFLPSLWFTG